MLKILHLKIVIPLFLFFASMHLNAQIEPLKNAHSHNDYMQKHPLTDALNNRFKSVEVDIFLINGELVVSHTKPLFKKPTFEELYLKPLQKIWRSRSQEIYRDEPLILLIDIKSDAEKTAPVLKEILQKYSEMLTKWSYGRMDRGAVTIVVTGNNSAKFNEDDTLSFIFLDQSLLTVKERSEKKTQWLASTKYSNILSWKGKGKIPEDQKKKLKELVEAAHFQGKIVRLWASPENKDVWTELLNCGVDLINTDKLTMLSEFLMERK